MAIPTQFASTFPCFAVLDQTGTSPCYVKSNSGIALVILTDDDLVARYRQSEPNALGKVIRFDSAPHLLAFFDSLPRSITHIAFDPTEKGQAVTVDFPTFANAVLPLIQE